MEPYVDGDSPITLSPDSTIETVSPYSLRSAVSVSRDDARNTRRSLHEDMNAVAGDGKSGGVCSKCQTVLSCFRPHFLKSYS